MSDADPVLNQINLVVRDMDPTLAFYRKLGLNISDATVWRTASGAHHAEVQMANGVFLEFDSMQLAKSYNAGCREPMGGSRGVLGFSLASRRAEDERFAALIAAVMSPLDPSRRRPPPAL